MKKAVVALLACFALWSTLLGAAHAQAQYKPELVGLWKGNLEHGARVLPSDPTPTYYNAIDPPPEITMTIIGQDDRSFHGLMGNQEERNYVVGVVRADGKSLLMSDDGGYKSATMLTPTRMEYCVQVASGDHMVAACGILEKQVNNE
ncbi:hypothetical protein [Hoeflea prorocentri]|uniref:Uncharacterized protein n=1 Tax=Hoeflea prorocentri TaxID=1922333 RepID=A0A9X3ULC5_9HYPH|nr:hypothetical protein [Hoeflea prorocentri]MCY6383373.1 hypothetical protein [Hoeflea prorocentri]MDA5401173.1 hypothetical protein [Hoeflea prorocentri]